VLQIERYYRNAVWILEIEVWVLIKQELICFSGRKENKDFLRTTEQGHYFFVT